MILDLGTIQLEVLLIGQIVAFVQALRKDDLEKTPAVAEALDFAAALAGAEGSMI